MALRMSAVRVAPMKMPSSWKAHTPTTGAATTHGRYSRAAARVASSIVSRSISAGPRAAMINVATTARPTAQIVVIRAAANKPARFAAPIARPTSASAANAKPSRK